ncbi:hypothetical protein D3C75_1152250 [compost metagenome]
MAPPWYIADRQPQQGQGVKLSRRCAGQPGEHIGAEGETDQGDGQPWHDSRHVLEHHLAVRSLADAAIMTALA